MFVSAAISAIVGLVSASFVTKLLPREDYGALSYVASLQGLVLAVSLPGLANAIAYSAARGYEAHFREGTLKRACLYFRNGLFLLPVAAWYWLHDNNPQLAILVALGGLLLPWSQGFDTSDQLLMGRGDFAPMFWRRTLTVVLIAASGIIAAALIPSAGSVLLGRSVVSFLLYLAIFLLLLRTVHNEHHDAEFNRRSRDFSVVSIVGTVAGLTDRLILGSMGNFGPLAGYSLALSISGPMDIITKSFNKLAFSKMADARQAHQRHFWVELSLAFVIFGTIAMLLVWRLVFPLVNAFFPKYPELVNMVPVLVGVGILNTGTSLGLVYAQFHAFEAWKRFNLIANASSIPVMVVAVFWGGVWGALWTNFIYGVIPFVFFNVVLWHGAEERKISNAVDSTSNTLS